MHVHRCTGLQLHVLANDKGVEDQIRALGREGHTCGVRSSATFPSDTPYVLAVGLEFDLLRSTVSQVKTELVGD